MQKQTNFTIEQISPQTIDEANAMRLNSWLDTYVNDDFGVTREWILKRNDKQMSPEIRKRRLDKLKDPHANGWVAKDSYGNVIGVTTPFIDSEGTQHLGSLYVEKAWHGKGVGRVLMQKAMDWLDQSKPIVLSVATYNERAKAFYRKWGFVEIPDSVTLFADKIPQIMMRKSPK